ncbi:MAG: UDP-N-acetylmuramate dehydrogenase [Ignavibacteria bacterium]
MSDISFKSVKLSDFTTINLGGAADKFVECKNDSEIINAVNYAVKENLSYHVLAGGSNTIFNDDGYKGVIIYINSKGILRKDDLFTVKAGENWDSFVEHTVNNGYSGIECLSGIPGSVGATPIQNVGAYGQEVSDVIESVKAINTKTLEFETFPKESCEFSYRNSRFKSNDKGKYIITEVTFKLKFNSVPVIKYKELKDKINSHPSFHFFQNNISKHILIRNTVLEIRAAKSMIYNKNDENSISCGSFFTNPLINEDSYNEFLSKCNELNLQPVCFKSGEQFKVSAAWLIENSGFNKGFLENGIGISSKHSLALINKGGSTKDLIVFSEKIQCEVFLKFGINLIREPELIS